MRVSNSHDRSQCGWRQARQTGQSHSAHHSHRWLVERYAEAIGQGSGAPYLGLADCPVQQLVTNQRSTVRVDGCRANRGKRAGVERGEA